MPRSGSTLLQRVLAGHAAVATSSEPWVMLHQVYGLRDVGIATDYSASWSQLGVSEFLENYTDGAHVYDAGVRAFAEKVYANARERSGARLFLDKTPRYVMIVDDLIRLFPEAKFVFLKRNPLSVLSSVLRTQIADDVSQIESFKFELLHGPAAIARGISKLGDNATVVSYEDFVAAPENELHRICQRLQLDYSAEMLEYTRQPEITGFMQDRTGVARHERPVGDSAHGWQKLLNDPQYLEFARGYLKALGQDVFVQLGYDFESINDAVRAASERHRGSGYVLPWRSAILTPEQRLGRDQADVTKYRCISDYGPFIGRIRAWARHSANLLKSLRWMIGRAPKSEEKSLGPPH